MKKNLKLSSYKCIRVMFTIFMAGCLFSFPCYKIQGKEKIAEKMPTILVNLSKAHDPLSYANIYGIRLKDGMVRVIITVDKDKIASDFPARYGLKDSQWRGDLVAGYVSMDGLKELSEEPAVIYIRLPISFMGGEELSGNVEK